jgi:hypothetical protein
MSVHIFLGVYFEVEFLRDVSGIFQSPRGQKLSFFSDSP